LADHVIARHYPDAAAATNPYRGLLGAVIARQASLIAQWMLVGFIHGVMNTDNSSVSGETIDYGPCAFLDAYDPATVFSSIDAQGRYAYANQPRIALWNLTRLAECLLPLLSDSQDAAVAEAQAALGEFAELFDAAYQSGLRRKLGLFTARDDDPALAQDLLTAMAANQADFTLTFRRLADSALDAADDTVRSLFADPAAYDAWAVGWRQRLALEPQDAATRYAAMRAANPAFIPRNHRIEAVIEAAVNRGDFALFEELIAILAQPFDDQPQFAEYANPPRPDERVLETFCGT
jgi:serine/tyrosine/threonine adenylyltransferase